MAILNIVGFETGDDYELGFTSGGHSVQGTTKRTGDYALQTNNGSTETKYVRIGQIGADGRLADLSHAECYFRFYWRCASIPGSGLARVAYIDGTDLLLLIGSDGHLYAYSTVSGGGGPKDTSWGNGSSTLTGGTWYRIEIKVNGAGPAWEVKLNGASELTGNDAYYSARTATNLVLGITNNDGVALNSYYDDVQIRSDAYPGVGEIHRMVPTGAGSNSNHNSGSYADVDEVPVSTADYLVMTGTGSNRIDTFAASDCSAAGIAGTVAAVKCLIIAISNPAGPNSTKPEILYSGNATVSSGYSVTSASQLALSVLAETYNGSNAFSTTILDSTELGYQGNGGDDLRVSGIYGMVDSDGASPQSGVISPLAVTMSVVSLFNSQSVVDPLTITMSVVTPVGVRPLGGIISPVTFTASVASPHPLATYLTPLTVSLEIFPASQESGDIALTADNSNYVRITDTQDMDGTFKNDVLFWLTLTDQLGDEIPLYDRDSALLPTDGAQSLYAMNSDGDFINVLQLDYVAASDGEYRALVSPSVKLVPGTFYTLRIQALNYPFDMSWNVEAVGRIG